jgi:hypothetical protein
VNRPGEHRRFTARYHALVMAALSGEVVIRAIGRTIQDHFAKRIRDACKADLPRPA